MTEATGPVLRVLTGRLAGTEKALPANGTVSIGHQFWQDVVIRDPATKGVAVDLAVDGDGAAQITVLSGEATMLGSELEAGRTAILPPYVPFSIGGVALAWGEPESERWGEAGGLAQATPAPALPPPDAKDQALAVLKEAGSDVRGVFRGRRAWALGAAGVLMVGAATALPAIDALGLRGDEATRVDRALAAAGLPALTVAPDPAGGVVVTGVVAREAERVRAQDVLRDSGLPGQISVQTSAELAQSVAALARTQNIQAQARPMGRTGVFLRTTPMRPDQRARLEQAVRTDLPLAGRLLLREDLVSAEDLAIRSVADLTKKVSSVIAGEPAYIQTVDGARYFPGAILPSGHRLLAIQPDAVHLEKNGRQLRLAT
ncbi:SctD/MshK family protein [Sphingomonas lenta]|uniref:YscD/Y4YQ C-terminal domain-containing protein n=1 Tax=Sphingomonas lenta TaxID=1141887 RepID=A0A2A2SCQ5_9SPHN|nr:hypothetical protein [Sphingomonas lenta]PAX06985.1 hypothetical protein CKY28_13030 [Sphingomonas lenta]